MNCPVCTSTPLAIADRLGIEIDYCPKCRGVWLDRGELDKILERALPEGPTSTACEAHDCGRGNAPAHHEHDHDRHDHDDDHGGRYRGRQRKSLLKDLFDF